MSESKFNVHFSYKTTFIVMLSYLILLGTIIAAVYYTTLDSTIAIIIVLYTAGLGVYSILGLTLYSVRVKDSEMTLRTKLGRHYKFNCSDITEVIVTKRNSVKYGPTYHIIILIKNKKIDLEWTMLCFEKMALYILEKFDSGEIIKSAVSPRCKRELSRLSKKRGTYIE
ncbi:MAG: hypothetical protein ACK5LC_18690 [Coprobacillaceae bacterium]